MTKRYAIFIGYLLGTVLLPFGALILADPTGFIVALGKVVAGGVVGGLIGLGVYLFLNWRQRMIDQRGGTDA